MKSVKIDSIIRTSQSSRTDIIMPEPPEQIFKQNFLKILWNIIQLSILKKDGFQTLYLQHFMRYFLF